VVSEGGTPQERARKRSNVVWLGIAGIGAGTVILGELSSSSSDDPISADLFQSTAECIVSGRYPVADCDRAFSEADRQQRQAAPRYATREDCAAEFGGAACTPVATQAGDPGGGASQFFAPAMAGFLIGSAAGVLSAQPAAPVYRSCAADSSSANCQSSTGSGGGGGGGRFYTGSGYSVTSNGTRASVMPAAFSPPAATTLSRGGFGARAMSVSAAS
jgi:uncharacterized protein YgiB involved in biofilm formation